jgi:hypothetical protein
MISIRTLIVVVCVVFSAHKAVADTPNPGFKSLHIGHSFFKPYAEGMPDYVAAAGIAGHSQTVVFAGGANGAPEALWNNQSKRDEIQAVLNAGDIELFGMTYHPTFPSTEGYENWIGYALEKNAGTRFFIAVPWTPYPTSFNAADYANSWVAFNTGFWQDFMDSIRALYPGVDIFSVPYGQSAGELRLLQAAGNLPDAPNLQGNASNSIFKDNLGHAGDILVDLGRLVWLRALYDVDLTNYSYGPSYATDLNALATAIMDGHDPEYDAAYRNDVDGDRVGDAIDNCISTPNPDQELAPGYTNCGAACVTMVCGAASCTNQ